MANRVTAQATTRLISMVSSASRARHWFWWNA
jgi:hypothetical protein